MTWLKLDDNFFGDPKIVAAGRDARDLFLAGLTYCSRHLTDGRIPPGALPILAAEAGVSNAEQLATRLVELNLWANSEEGFAVPKFLKYNPSAADIGERKSWDQKRKGIYSNPQLLKQVRQRDGDICRYCRNPVDWRDRRGQRGGTYDLVVPRGDNTFENIVVACRACNEQKRQRTPEEAGMPLFPPPVPAETGGGRLGIPDAPSRPIAAADAAALPSRIDPVPSGETAAACARPSAEILVEEFYEAIGLEPHSLTRTLRKRELAIAAQLVEAGAPPGEPAAFVAWCRAAPYRPVPNDLRVYEQRRAQFLARLEPVAAGTPGHGPPSGRAEMERKFAHLGAAP